MIKLIQNRTIGLQKKTIQDSTTVVNCNACCGTGITTITLPAGSIRNLKVKSQLLVLQNECEKCDDGKVTTKLRVIRKNPVSLV